MRPGQGLALSIPNNGLLLSVRCFWNVLDSLVEVRPLRSESLQVGCDLLSAGQRRHGLSDLSFALLLRPFVLIHQAKLGVLSPVYNLDLLAAPRARLRLAFLQLGLLFGSLMVYMHSFVVVFDLHVGVKRFILLDLSPLLAFELLQVLVLLEVGLVIDFGVDFIYLALDALFKVIIRLFSFLVQIDGLDDDEIMPVNAVILHGLRRLLLSQAITVLELLLLVLLPPHPGFRLLQDFRRLGRVGLEFGQMIL